MTTRLTCAAYASRERRITRQQRGPSHVMIMYTHDARVHIVFHTNLRPARVNAHHVSIRVQRTLTNAHATLRLT